uniref:Prenylcysteine oxidase 1 n=1 Tax=Hucho hucho TaxID=62062 RepID=A0A4W5P3M0_9TELE
ASELRNPPKTIGKPILVQTPHSIFFFNAYFVRQEFGAVVKFNGGGTGHPEHRGYEYETGGAVLHPLNLHIKHFLERLTYGMAHGKELTFVESDWFIGNFLRLLQRYRFNFLRMQMWVESVLDKFTRNYQKFSYSFSNVEKLVHAMGGDGFLTLANERLEEAKLGEYFSQSFLIDVVAPVTRVNYGQSVRIIVFLGTWCLAGADPCLWAVDGGNKVCSGLLYHSKDALIPARVTAISVKLRPFKAGTHCICIYKCLK